jgi:hypothetical protein
MCNRPVRRPNEEIDMNTLTKIAAAAVLAGSFAASLAAPADAGVIVRVGIGAPVHPVYGYGYGYGRDWCFYHPYACTQVGYVAPGAPIEVGPVVVGGYADGFFVEGRGYWHEGRFWGHREFFHGGWRFR